MVTMLRSAPVAPMLAPVIGVANADCAGRQEATGRFRFGSGLLPWPGQYEDGTRPVVHPTAWTVAAAIEKFAEVVPACRDAQIAEIWAGLIDLTPDALPVIDAPGAIEGLLVAMGFSGHGFCLGPVTGRIVASLARREKPDLPIDAFRIDRFNTPAPRREAVTLHG
jgi:sarcosine oxidase subunit beta